MVWYWYFKCNSKLIGHNKKFKQSGKETDKDNFKYGKLSLKKIINNKKKLYFEEKIAENKINPKELRRTLIGITFSLGMPSKEERQSKTLLKENGGVLFDLKKNGNIIYTNIIRFITTKTSTFKKQIWNQNH